MRTTRIVAVVLALTLAYLTPAAPHPQPTVGLIPPIALSRSAEPVADRDWTRPALTSSPPPTVTPSTRTSTEDAMSPRTEAHLSRSAAAAKPTAEPSPPGSATRSPEADAGTAPTSGPSAYASSLVTPGQWRCLNLLWARESGWNPAANNPHSTAFGVAQMLTETSTDYRVQVRDGLGYIGARYGTTCEALRHSDQTGWY